jgi:hypothetical protein
LAGSAQQYANAWINDGIVVVYVLAETMSGQTPNQQNLNQYSNQYGMDDVIVVSDPGWQFSSHFEQDGYIPTVALVKYDGTILVKDNENQFNSQLGNAAPPYGGP